MRTTNRRPILPEGSRPRFYAPGLYPSYRSSRRQDDLHVGLLFLQMEEDRDVEHFDSASGIHVEVRKVATPPSYTELVDALAGAKYAYSVGPWLDALGHELVLRNCPSAPGSRIYGHSAGVLLDLLAVATDSAIVSTSFALSSSWSDLPSRNDVRAVELSSCFMPPMRLPWGEQAVPHNPRVDQTSLSKVREWMANPPALLEAWPEAVGLAQRCLRTYFHDADERGQVARLWIGIEALASVISPNDRSSSRIARMGAEAISGAGGTPSTKDDSYKYVRSLQKWRNRAVHGAVVDRAKMSDIVLDTAHVLRSMLSECMDGKYAGRSTGGESKQQQKKGATDG